MEVLKQLENEGYKELVDIDLSSVGDISIATSNKGVIFYLNDISDISYVRQVIHNSPIKAKYLVFVEEKDKYFWSRDSYGSFSAIDVPTFIEQAKGLENTERDVDSFADSLRLSYSTKKELNLVDGNRVVKRGKEWQLAFSLEDSNDFYSSLLFLGPLGVHHLSYKDGIKSYFKFLLFFFTAGGYGSTLLDGMILLWIGKLYPVGLIEPVEEDKAKWVIPEKSADNIKKLLLAIVYTVAMVLLNLWLGGKLLNFLVSVAQNLIG